MRFLVTGATGFIGRHLVRRLIEEGKGKIFALARNTSRTGVLPSSVQIIYGDISSLSSCRRALADSNPDVVFHCAGFVGEDKRILWQVNVEGTRNIAEATFREGAEKLVYLSSVSVNSASASLPLEEGAPFGASNIYGESKMEAEKIIWDYARRGLKVTVLRPCMVYGEDEPHMLGLILWLLRRRLYPIIGKGSWKWHLLYVENLVDAMLLAQKAENRGPYNIADREVLSAREVFGLMAEVLGVSPPWHLPLKAAYWLGGAAEVLNKAGLHIPFSRRSVDFLNKDRIYSIERAMKEINYNPRWNTKEALRLSVKKYCNNYA